MLHLQSCNVNHNSESIFCYFARGVNSNLQNVIEKIFMLSVVTEAFQKLVPLYIFCKLIVWYTATGLLKSPCIAHQPD